MDISKQFGRQCVIDAFFFGTKKKPGTCGKKLLRAIHSRWFLSTWYVAKPSIQPNSAVTEAVFFWVFPGHLRLPKHPSRPKKGLSEEVWGDSVWRQHLKVTNMIRHFWDVVPNWMLPKCRRLQRKTYRICFWPHLRWSKMHLQFHQNTS